MKFKLTKLAAALGGAAVLALAGCGGGGGSDPAPLVTTMMVSPSLGKFSPGTVVTLKRLNGEVLGTGNVGSTGQATISIPTGYSGPVLIEVTGGPGITYYDEGTKTNVPFGSTDILKAVLPTVQAVVGVTPATHAAAVMLGDLADDDSSSIRQANNKVQTALGITDLLQAPTLVDGASSGLTLGSAADVYALKLAALAILATDNGANAWQLTKNLASDLADGLIDGNAGTEVIVDLSYEGGGDFVINLAIAGQEAAAEFGDTNTQAMVNNNPSLLGTADDDVQDVAIPANVDMTDLAKAKALFTELRTTLVTTFGLDGFLDLQAFKAGDDLKETVAPKLDVVSYEISALALTTRFYNSVKGLGSDTLPFVQGYKPGTNNTVAALTYREGNCSDSNALYAGQGTCSVCWTDTNNPATVTKASCDVYDAVNVDYSQQKFKTVMFSVSSNQANQYSYSAFKYINPVTFGNNGIVIGDDPVRNKPADSTGTFTTTVNASGITTGLNLTGTLPASTDETAVDAVTLNVTFTEPAANTYRMSLAGSVATSTSADATKTARLAFETGSYIEMQEINAQPRITSAKIIGVAQSAANKFAGSISLGNFAFDKSATAYEPTNIVFEGSISDLASGGAGQYLTGKLELTNSLANWDDRNMVSNTNYESATATFTGTVKMPERPEMKLVLSGTDTTTPNTEPTASLNYSYGAVSITGSATATGDLVLSNQDGIQIAQDPTQRSVFFVTKSGTRLATVTNNVVNYIDGSSYSLK